MAKNSKAAFDKAVADKALGKTAAFEAALALKAAISAKATAKDSAAYTIAVNALKLARAADTKAKEFNTKIALDETAFKAASETAATAKATAETAKAAGPTLTT